MSDRAPLGSLDWLDRTGGALTFAERVRLLAGGVSTLVEGARLRRRALGDPRREVLLSALEPPDTPIVAAARAALSERAGPEMERHAWRTGFWTVAVLHQHDALTDASRETAWVAALLHDVGLDQPPARGDFSVAGVERLRALGREHGWSESRVREAGEAIATNLCTGVRAERVGEVAWAMNVGGLGELGFPLHRAQWHPDRVRELERRFPRDGFRDAAMRAIEAEARRVPGGRFALLGRFFPWIMLRER